MVKGPSVLVIGEALVDRLPGGSLAAGAPLNVAASLAALGVPVALVSRLNPADDDGVRLLAAVRRLGLPVDALQTDFAHATGAATVEMSGSTHRFVIHDDAAWDFIDADAALRTWQRYTPRVLVFNTLAQRSVASRAAVRALARGGTGALRYLDVNLRDGPDNRAIAMASLALADWVKANDDELALLLDWYAGGGGVPALMRRFSLQRLILTRGAAGYAAYDAQGYVEATGRAAPLPRLVDTIGAGDAFSAVLIASLLRGQELAAGLEWANRYAADICGHAGALPADDAFFSNWRARLDAAWSKPAP